MKHHPKLKRGLALALSALCLASVCVGVVSAAPASSSTNPRIGLDYEYNRTWDVLNKDKGIQIDTSKTAYILAMKGHTVTVQMSLGNADLPSEEGEEESTALNVTDKTTGKPLSGSVRVTGTGQPGRYEITAKDLGGTKENPKQVQVNVEANINSVTTNSGYNGTVNARKDNKEGTNPVGGDAKLLTPLAISETSSITIRCTEGEYGNFQPTFEITDATGVLESYYKQTYITDKVVFGTVSFRKESDTGSPFIRNRKIVVEVSAPGKTPLMFEFDQPVTYNLIANDDNSGYLDSKFNLQMDSTGKKIPFSDDSNPDLVRVANNYIRKDSTYTLTFVKPISDILSLTIAEPQYVVNQIKQNIQSNRQDSYLKLSSGDRLSMVTGDIELTTYDFRYNADFDIEWIWDPDTSGDIPAEYNSLDAYKTAAQKVIQTPAPNQGTAETPTSKVKLRPLVDDISGTLKAIVTCRDDKSVKAEYEFPKITVRGTGIPATVVATGQKVGEESGAKSTKFETKVKDENGNEITVIGKALPTRLAMDVFQGGIERYKKKATGPCIYDLELRMGQKNARSVYAVARLTGDTGAVSLYTQSDQNAVQQYTPGTQIENPNYSVGYTVEGTRTLQVRAEKPGTVTLTIDYYVKINGKDVVDSTHSMEIVVTDSTPSKDATLSALTLRDAGRSEPAINFGFKPDKISYISPTIELPYVYEEYDLTPVVNEPVAAETPVKVTAFDSQGNPAALFGNGLSSEAEVYSGRSLRLRIPEEDVGRVYTVNLTVQAANPDVESTYTLAVMRLRPSEDDMLRSLGFYAQADTAGKSNYLTDFNPETREYVITVPYSTKYLRVNAVPRFARAEVAFSPALESMSLFGAKEYLKVESLTETGTFEGVSGLPYFTIDVTPEINLTMDKADEGRATGHYKVFVNRLPPSENSRVTAMTVADAADQAATPKAFPYVPSFNANNPGPYRMTDSNAVPYSVSAVRFKITPQDTLVSAIRIYRVENEKPQTPPVDPGTEEGGEGGGEQGGGEQGGGEQGGGEEGGESGTETRSRSRAAARAEGEKRTLVATITNPAVYSEPVALVARNTELAYNEFIIEVVSEAGDGLTGPELDAKDRSGYYTEYRIQIERGEANNDADLLGVALNNQEGNPLKMFAFHRDETNYDITVPYAVRSVSFTATFSDPHATVVLKDNDDLLHQLGMSLDPIRHNVASKFYKLNDPGSPRKFELMVTAEDGITPKTYTFNIDREPPSNDALLKKLTVDGLTETGLSPLFKPHDTAYSGTVEEGAEGIRITPTANDKNATIMVDGAEVKSGHVSDLIELLEEKVKLDIVVTAEDGKTQKIYTLDLFNQNLVEKTNDADLGSLKVERGVMTPEFKAAVTEYEVAVKEDTYSVDIIPKPDDPLAEVKVLSGTREIGDYNGNYGLALADGENEVTVRVTSPDKTKVKDYNITIYRNQEDALKTLTPLTADDVDFEKSENPIVISVAEYPRIESSVFNALKEYPEKTIVFQGLDYSLTFQASNLNTVIPTREIYDFRLSFESLDADEIKAHMGQWDANAAIMDDLVMIYFDYHGDLPGPAMLNLKLGNKYGGQTLYWHYYNRDRKKIEFYGTLRSNAQGSISVPLNHFSTYLLTRRRMITGAENYGNTLSQIRATIGAKQNPTTGADSADGAAAAGDAAVTDGAADKTPEDGT